MSLLLEDAIYGRTKRRSFLHSCEMQLFVSSIVFQINCVLSVNLNAPQFLICVLLESEYVFCVCLCVRVCVASGLRRVRKICVIMIHVNVLQSKSREKPGD